MRLEDVLIDFYYTTRWNCGRNRFPSNLHKMSWFITQDLGLIRTKHYPVYDPDKSKWVTKIAYKTMGFDKRVEPVDLEGETFFICPCEEYSKNGEMLKSQGWEVIPFGYLDIESKAIPC